MTDIEMTRLCAEAMGYQPVIDDTFQVCFCHKCEEHPFSHWAYRPLEDDVQVMALVKKFPMETSRQLFAAGLTLGYGNTANKVIVECVAKMWAAKK